MGLKGLKIGGAEISTMHANFIINNSSASSKDIYELITVIQQKVLQNKGIYLQPEVRMIGFDYPIKETLKKWLVGLQFWTTDRVFKKAKQIQQDAQKLQDELENMEIEGKSEDEMVKVWIMATNSVKGMQENIFNSDKEK